MTTFHISRRGEPAVCRAKEGACPLAGLEGQAHGTREEVLAALENVHGGPAPRPVSKAGDRDKILKLRDELFTASQAYYQGGVSSLTDDEYDDRKTYLSHLVAKSGDEELQSDEVIRAILEERVAAGTGVVEGQASLSRSVPMLSQRKADTREEVEDYLRDALAAGATGFKLQAKLDGISFAAIYSNGELVHCTGRGDGSKGQDYTGPIKSGSVKVEGLPITLEGDLARGTVEFRGELFVRKSEFDRANEERSRAGAPPVGHPQIMVSSSLNRGSSSSRFTFVVFTKLVHGSRGEEVVPYEASDLASAGLLEISVLTEEEWTRAQPDAPNFTGLRDLDSLMSGIDAFGDARPHLDVPTDGIVVKPLNEVEMLEKMGSTAHHPRSQIAYKYQGAMGISPVKDLTWTVRGTGEISAQLSFEPLDLAGKSFGRTSLPYALLVEESGLGPDSEVLIEKYRDQSAKFRSVQGSSERRYEVPKACPSCGGRLEKMTNRPDPGNRLPQPYTSLHCSSQTCPTRVASAYGRGGVEYDGLGPAKVKAAQAAGLIKTSADLARLTSVEAWKKPDGTFPKGITLAGAAKLAESVRTGREELRGNLELGLGSLHLYGLTRDRIAHLSGKYSSTDEIASAPVRELAKAFDEDLHETEQTNMLPTSEECAVRLQRQLRESLALQSYKEQGINF